MDETVVNIEGTKQWHNTRPKQQVNVPFLLALTAFYLCTFCFASCIAIMLTTAWLTAAMLGSVLGIALTCLLGVARLQFR
jgi:hypothetical protein